MNLKEAKKIIAENKQINDEVIKKYIEANDPPRTNINVKEAISKIDFNKRKEEYNAKRFRTFKLAYAFTCLVFVLLLGIGLVVSYNVGMNNMAEYYNFGILNENEIDILTKENTYYFENCVATINVTEKEYLYIFYAYNENVVNYYYKYKDGEIKDSNIPILIYNNENMNLESAKLIKFATQPKIENVNTLNFEIKSSDNLLNYSIQVITE